MLRSRALFAGLPCLSLAALSLVLLVAGCAEEWRGSVGAVFSQNRTTHRVFVREVPAGMGAARAGIAVDDELLAVDGQPVADMTPAEVHARLGGNVGTRVKLRLRRKGEVVECEVERGPYQSTPVAGAPREGGKR